MSLKTGADIAEVKTAEERRLRSRETNTVLVAGEISSNLVLNCETVREALIYWLRETQFREGKMPQIGTVSVHHENHSSNGWQLVLTLEGKEK